MRAAEGVLIIAGVLFWGAAFYFGPNTELWILGKTGVFLIGLAALLRVTEFLIPNKKPQPKKRKKGAISKCRSCGKPTVSGSEYCSYHTRYGPEGGRR